MTKSAAQTEPSFASHNEGVLQFLSTAFFPHNRTAAAARSRARRRAANADRTKRAVDIAGAIVGLILFGPLMAIIAILIAAEGAPALFAHERIGRGGKPFRCLKFRTMAPNAQALLEALLESDPEAREEWARDRKLRRDPRITRVGRFLRRSSLDELPQFINVLKGDMSLVGPRPIVADEIERYNDKFALYASCRPGITGIWQVSGRNDTSYERRVALDAHYATNRSLHLDASILLRTFGVVVTGSGAS